MRKFIIEREIPGAGTLEREQLKEAAARSNAALAKLAPDIQWVESYVADDKTFCVYLAKDEALIRKHAEISGFPANKITPIKRLIDPTTASRGRPRRGPRGGPRSRAGNAPRPREFGGAEVRYSDRAGFVEEARC
jgi:hypothetical protein